MGCYLSFKAMFRGLAVAGIILLVLIVTLQQADGRKMKKTLMTSSTMMEWSGKDEHEKVLGRQRSLVHPQLDNINYMSKRRVPNGPDPIHNRKRPPGTV